LRHAHRLEQRQIEKNLNCQGELDTRPAALRAVTSLATGTTVPAHALAEPDAQGDERRHKDRSLSNWWFDTSILLGTHSASLPCANARSLNGPICAIKPLAGLARYGAHLPRIKPMPRCAHSRLLHQRPFVHRFKRMRQSATQKSDLVFHCHRRQGQHVARNHTVALKTPLALESGLPDAPVAAVDCLQLAAS
jgi:hypothetical protein